MEGSSQKDKGLMDMDKCGACRGAGGIRGLDGNGQNTIKVKKK